VDALPATLASRAYLFVEPEFPFLSRAETAQAGKAGRLSLAQAGDDLVNQAIQSIRSLGF
jgi:hypothetical protein